MNVVGTQHAPAPVSLVTGAASGIGLATVRLLSRRGQRVAGWDVNGPVLAQRMAEVQEETRSEVRAYCVDVSDAARVQACVGEVESSFGPIDALAHVAGILRMGSALTLDAAAFQACLAINTGGVFQVTQAVARHMVARRRGAIVVVASNAAHTPRVDMAAYAASKAAALMFTRCLALEVASAGVRCNVVCPGSTDTPMQRAFWGEHSGPEQTIRGSLERHRLGIALGRIAHPDDIAESIAFLLSEAARQITLQALTIDGGATF